MSMHHEMSRRSFLKGVAAFGAVTATAAGLAGCSQSQSSATASSAASTSATSASASADAAAAVTGDPIRVGIPSGSYLPLGIIIADNLGYFEDEGLNVQLQDMKTSGAAAITSGDLDVFTSGHIPAMNMINAGETKIVMIGGIMSNGGEYTALADKGLTLSKPEDFEGLSIACMEEDPCRYQTQAVLEKAGVEPNFVFFSSQQEVMAAVTKDEVDMAIACNGSDYAAVMDGSCVRLGKVIDFVKNEYPCCRVQVNTDFAEGHRGDLVAFEKCMLKGYDVYRNDKELALDILAEYSGQDKDVIEGRMYGNEKYDTPMVVAVDPDTDAVIDEYDYLVESGFFQDNDINIEDYLDITYYQSALEELMSEDSNNALWTELDKTFKANNKKLLA